MKGLISFLQTQNNKCLLTKFFNKINELRKVKSGTVGMKKYKFIDLFLDDYDYSDWFVPPLEGN